MIPITFATASNPDFINTKPTHVISEEITVINRGSVGDEWVVLNKQQTGKSTKLVYLIKLHTGRRYRTYLLK